MNESSEFFVGMDVHKDSISFAVLTETSPSPVLQVRKTNTHRAVDETLDKLYGQGTVFACYEAGPCGYGLARYIESKGIQCQVFAPGKIPRKPGERRKTDRRDALKLAQLLKHGEGTPVHFPNKMKRYEICYGTDIDGSKDSNDGIVTAGWYIAFRNG